MKRPRKAVFVRPSLSVSGADRWAVDAALALQQHDWAVEIAVNAYNQDWTFPEAARGDVRVTAFGGLPLWCTFNRLRALSSVVNQWLLLRRLRRRADSPDLIIGDIVPQSLLTVRQLFPEAAALYYCHFPDRLGVPAATGLYGAYREAMGRREDRAMQAAHGLVANSHYTAEAMRRTFPLVDKERVVVVHPGVRRPAAVSPTPASGAGAQRTWLTVARFDPAKGLDLAIEAFARLREELGPDQFKSCRLVLAGGYDRRLPEVHALVRALRTQASRLGVAGQVELVFDPSDEALSRLFQEALALVHPAPAEHFGIVLIEAMAFGLPVLAVSNGGPKEIVVPGKTGELRPAEAGPFAQVMARWIQDPTLASRLGAAGRVHAAAEFSLTKFTAAFAAQAERAWQRGTLS